MFTRFCVSVRNASWVLLSICVMNLSPKTTSTIFVTLTGTECPASSWESSNLLLKRPSLGPKNAAPNKEHVPPRRWTGPQPEKSLYPIWFSQPSCAHTQRLTIGYTNPTETQCSQNALSEAKLCKVPVTRQMSPHNFTVHAFYFVICMSNICSNLTRTDNCCCLGRQQELDLLQEVYVLFSSGWRIG
jgi:hypothetical protein